MTRDLRYPPFAKPGVSVSTRETPSDELPSIDRFIDAFPPIEDFLADVEVPESEPSSFVAESPLTVTRASEGWASGEWQSYDWSSLSSLNRNPVARQSAAESWGESDWPGDAPSSVSGSGLSSSTDTPTAAEIADALDGMARRVRSGELRVDNPHVTPEAAMAAALAVLLRMRG